MPSALNQPVMLFQVFTCGEIFGLSKNYGVFHLTPVVEAFDGRFSQSDFETFWITKGTNVM